MLLRIHISTKNRCDAFLIDIPEVIYKNRSAYEKLLEKIKEKLEKRDYSSLPEDAVFESLEENNDYYKFVEPDYIMTFTDASGKLEVR